MQVVSLVKLQLVGVTAMFIAAKYEEILAPSVDEFVFMTERGYERDEILKGERIILSTLDFNVSSYCSPYSWCRRISKADDYDIQTRTLSKFLMEMTLLDHRFLRARPSLIAAIGMYSARKMLGGEWVSAYFKGLTLVLNYGRPTPLFSTLALPKTSFVLAMNLSLSVSPTPHSSRSMSAASMRTRNSSRPVFTHVNGPRPTTNLRPKWPPPEPCQFPRDLETDF
jgi:hypothetical protein